MVRISLLVTVLAIPLAVAAVAMGKSEKSSPAQLADAGWSCAVLFGAVHCLPPGTSLRSPSSPSLTALVFGTLDPEATDAPFLGTEHLLRADIFEKGGAQPPCPQDPPTFEYKDLRTTTELPIPYYACHHYDSSF